MRKRINEIYTTIRQEIADNFKIILNSVTETRNRRDLKMKDHHSKLRHEYVRDRGHRHDRARACYVPISLHRMLCYQLALH